MMYNENLFKTLNAGKTKSLGNCKIALRSSSQQPPTHVISVGTRHELNRKREFESKRQFRSAMPHAS